MGGGEVVTKVMFYSCDKPNVKEMFLSHGREGISSCKQIQIIQEMAISS